MSNIIAKRIKMAMNEQKITPIELSKRTGINKSSISQYMNGIVKPKHDRIYMIAKELKVSPSWLAGINDNKNPMSEQIEVYKSTENALFDSIFGGCNEDMKELFYIISNLSEENIKTLLVMARALNK